MEMEFMKKFSTISPWSTVDYSDRPPKLLRGPSENKGIDWNWNSNLKKSMYDSFNLKSRCWNEHDIAKGCRIALKYRCLDLTLLRFRHFGMIHKLVLHRLGNHNLFRHRQMHKQMIKPCASWRPLQIVAYSKAPRSPVQVIGSNF